MATNGAPASGGGPPATLIYNDWYPAMRSEGLRGKQLKTALLLGIPMVLGRKDGRAAVCDARHLPAPRDSAVVRVVRRADA